MRQLVPEFRPLEGAEELEDSYFPPGSPHLRINFVASLDGAIEVGGRSAALGGPADKAAFMAMRAVSDAVVVGAETARGEHYGPVRLDDDVQDRRRARGQSPLPPLVVVTARGSLTPDARMFEGDRNVIILTVDSVARARADLAEVAELVGCGTDMVDLKRARSFLHERGLHRLLCEGGPSLCRSLFEVGLVDQLCLTISPMLAGMSHHNLSQMWPNEPERFRLEALMEGDGLIFTRYAVKSQ